MKTQAAGRSRVLQGVLTVYKYTLSPMFHALNGPGQGCGFEPSCSEYAVLAWHEHGAFRGGWMAFRRVLRCHPFSRGGFDPVPARAEKTC